MAYWDTSCMLKLFAPEPDSAVFAAYVRGGVTIVTSTLTRFELPAALCRKESAGDMHRGAASRALAAYDAAVGAGRIVAIATTPVVETTYEAVVARCYGRAPPLAIRTVDAIHLATATVSGELEMVVTDKRLREAATVERLSLLTP